jgi:serine/threonine protein kinase/formylglycine-generating enzyme required for sulfatase activity
MPGARIFERYVLESIAGRGGMGVVWRARDEKLDRRVALKFLPAEIAADAAAVADLKRETKRCLEMTHANIVRVYDFVDGDFGVAISMELVEGESLAKRRADAPGGCLSATELVPLVKQLCVALDFAHLQSKVVHRDLKPANLLVTPAGWLKVTDFGIAHSLSETQTRRALEAGDSSGTPPYMSPQQLAGERPTAADDIYSLGATLYELLTGRPPFYRGDATGLRTQIATRKPTPLAQHRAEAECEGAPIPDTWSEVILACLEKDPALRPASAGTVARRLGVASDTTSAAVPSVDEGPTRRVAPVIPKKSGKRGVVALVALLAVGSVAGWFATRRADSAADTTQVLPQKNTPAPPVQNAPVPTATSGKAIVTISAQPGTEIAATDVNGRAVRLGVADASGTLTSGDRLTPGVYRFRLTHPDYQPVEMADVNVTDESGRITRLAPEQLFRAGELRISSAPSGATVLVNGVAFGTTPASLPNQPSNTRLRVSVRLPGYRAASREVTLKPGETRAVPFDALVAEGGAIKPQLVSRGQPLSLDGVTYLVDGREVFATSGVIDGVKAGAHTVEVRHADYEPVTASVVVRDEATATADFVLTPKPGRLTLAISGPAAFDVLVNDRAVSIADGRVTLPANEELALTVRAKGFVPVRRKISLPPNGTEALALTLERVNVPDAGQPWTIPDLGSVLLPVAAGSFTMGSEANNADEKPLTRVTLTRPFWLGKTEVTQGEFRALMNANPSEFKSPDERAPVDSVTWNEAAEYCRRLTERERAAERLPAGYIYALPTEAQWEFVCRASATEGAIDALAWHRGNSGERPRVVGTKSADAHGFHDLLGNLWEWCADWYGAYPGASVTDPRGPANGTVRVFRGGSAGSFATSCRPTARAARGPEVRTGYVGLRVALVPEATR